MLLVLPKDIQPNFRNGKIRLKRGKNWYVVETSRYRNRKRQDERGVVIENQRYIKRKTDRQTDTQRAVF